MVSKEELRIWRIWQFFDKYGIFPNEKKKVLFTISGENYVKLRGNRSKQIDDLIKTYI